MILDLMTAIATPDPRDSAGAGKARRLFVGAPPKVLSIAGLIGRAIQSIHEETSVSSLFV